ncbi:MAG: tripartite tricarboxylate transporter substrate binding protein [Burkholderiaceae bacterium]|jgi:tripartite-type tricarboxylate transporter receptor subunit TctC
MNPLTRRIRHAAALCLLALGLAGPSAMAQVANYPNKPIRLVLGYAPGGVADITARLVAQKLSESMGQPVVVDNKPSAGGIVAGEMVAKADPDGYTLLHMNYGNAVSAALFKQMPYDIKRDFQPVSAMGFFDVVMLVDKGSDIRSVQDFIAKAKANPDKYNIGSVSLGSGQHMAATLFKSLSEVPATLVPYKTTPSLMLALKSKDIEVAFEIVSPSLALLRSGELRALAMSSTTRFRGLPDVPTLAETGVKGYDVTAWNGIAAPARTPRAIVERLNREINAVLALPEVRAKFQEVGIDARGGSPEDLRDTLAAEIDKWNRLVALMKIERL